MSGVRVDSDVSAKRDEARALRAQVEAAWSTSAELRAHDARCSPPPAWVQDGVQRGEGNLTAFVGAYAIGTHALLSTRDELTQMALNDTVLVLFVRLRA